MSDEETPFGLKKTRKGCGCSGSSDVTIVNIDGRGVGIRGMKEIFEDLEEKEISLDDVDKDELIERFREDNYIPTKKEKEYKEALLSEYRNYIG
ncbi:MAG: hypothetical protein KGY66_06940 [Candidatus Thermoplasmatota archaeon]|nr:hypothetical protein [Candidatus Thermoplasmatota archaeon]